MLLIIAAILLIPSTRETVAGWLGVPGIEIQFRDDDEPTPTIAATPMQDLGLLLGEPVTLEEARQRVDFDIAIPEAPGLGMPDEIYVRLRPGADQVVFLYGARPGFPAAAETGIGLLLIQFEAPDDAFWGVKQVSGSNDVRVVDVNGDEALWIGGSHLLMIAPNPDPVSSAATHPRARHAHLPPQRQRPPLGRQRHHLPHRIGPLQSGVHRRGGVGHLA